MKQAHELLSEVYEDLQDVHMYLQFLEGKDGSEMEFIGASWVMVDSLISEIKEFMADNKWFIGTDKRISTND